MPQLPSFGNQSAQMFGGVRGANQQSQQGFPFIPIAMMAGGMLSKGLGDSQNQPMPWDQVQGMFGPGALTQGTDQIMGGMMKSPFMTTQMRGASQLGNRMQANMASNMGQSGLSGTPMAGMIKAAGMGYGGQLRMQQMSKMYQQAQQMAMQNLMMQAGMFGQNQQNQINAPNFWSQFGSSLLGAGAQGMMG